MPPGDAVIKRFCEITAVLLRPTEVFGRFGGEEFAQCCQDQASKRPAFALSVSVFLLLKTVGSSCAIKAMPWSAQVLQ